MSRLFCGEFEDGESRKSRIDNIKPYRKKIFLAFEGGKIEPEYFDEIKFYLRNSTEVAVDLFIVDRTIEDGKSHPRHVRDGLEEYYIQHLKGEIDEEDKLWIVIDIDQHFGNKYTSEKDDYLDFLSTLKTDDGKIINASVSKPCFELWLILQYTEAEKLDLLKIKRNKKTDNKTYTKRLLKRLKLENPNILLEDKIHNAVENSKSILIENDIEKLHSKVGTNLIDLFELILKG